MPERTVIAARVNRCMALFRDRRNADAVFLDFAARRATAVWVGATKQGGNGYADFHAALPAVRLGKRPVTELLKKAPVGVDKP